MRVCIYEDQSTADLEPLTLTRPASDLLCGLDSLGEKQARYFAAEVVGHLCRPHLGDVLRERHPGGPTNDAAWLRAGPVVLVNSRWLPPTPTGLRVAPGTRRLFASGPSIGTCQGELAFAILDQRRLLTIAPDTIDDTLTDLKQSLPGREVGGQLVRRPWDLIEKNREQLKRDFESLCPTTDRGWHPTGFAVVGSGESLYVHPSARIDPMVVADTSKGPVWIGPDVEITAFTRLEGPCAVGAGTQLLGAKIRAGTTIGPHCRIGGEVEQSIVQGFANKYHDGFLGHSYVGEWVNLAAGTITGDLRFDYQPIDMKSRGTKVPTGLTKLGSLIGDHTRTGLSVLLDCGTTIGAFASLLPTGRFAPRQLSSFTRHGPDGVTLLTDVDAVLAGSRIAMQRRGRTLTPALEKLYRSLSGQREVRPHGIVPESHVRISA
jgi:UDP-N-acetylglucosamine diphosphorylase/glucosamine-1-phosphate N-acetyltransferase